MNSDRSTVEHLARMGFHVASPLDIDRWFSLEYWEETATVWHSTSSFSADSE
jgi:hypothetical protein